MSPKNRVDSISQNEPTLLQIACLKEHIHIAVYLLNTHELDIHEVVNGVSALDLLFRHGSLASIQSLLHSYIVPFDNDGNNLIHNACKNGNKEFTRYLIEECNWDPNLPNTLGETPFVLACQSGNKDLAQYMIEEIGIQYPQHRLFGKSVMLAPLQAGQSAMGLYLLKKGFFDQRDLSLAFPYQEGYEARRSLSLKKGAHPDGRVENGEYPLQIACKECVFSQNPSEFRSRP